MDQRRIFIKVIFDSLENMSLLTRTRTRTHAEFI